MLSWQEFTLGVLASLGAVALCWFHRISGPEWVVAQSVIMGTNHGAGVILNWIKAP